MTSNRIAMLTQSVSLSGGGVTTAAAGLCRALSRTKSDVTLYSAGNLSTGPTGADWGDVEIMAPSHLGPASYCFQPGLSRLLEEKNPQIVHLHGMWTYHSYAALKASALRPVILSPHGMLDRWALANSAVKKKVVLALYERRMLARLACVHALCEPELQAIRDAGLDAPVAVIPNGVDLPEANRVHRRPDWMAGIPADAKVMLFLARIHPKKGLARFLDAFAKAMSEGACGWHMAIAGWDQNGTEAGLRAQVNERGIADHVHFIGPQFGADKDASFAAADAFVLPSYSEGLPMGVLEAWSHKLPVLMTDACNLKDGFAEGAAHRLSDYTDGMAHDLTHFLGMSEVQRHEMGEKGYELVRRQYVWEEVARKMNQTYEWLLRKTPKPDFVEMAR